MDKPTPGELKNVDVQLVSLVERGANRAKFKIFKSEDPVETEKAETQAGAEDETAPAAQGEPKTEVEKADYQGYSLVTALGIEEAEANLWRLFDAIRAVYGNILASAELIDKNAAIAQLAEDVKAYLLKRTEGLGVVKSEEPGDVADEAVEKAGRKIAASRLQALKEAMTLIEQIISEAESSASEGESGEASQAVAKAQESEPESGPLAEIVQKVESIEKANAELSGAVETAVSKAVEPVLARLSALEKARGASNQIIDESVAKQQPAGTFGGVIFGRR